MRVNKQDYDFAGWVTKNDVKCSDGRTIRQNAFAHMDGKTVPLVYNHNHSDIENVLGNVLLENRKEGVYGYAKTNGTGRGTAAKECVQHGDIVSFSIYANHLKETNTGDVMHGDIKEVSLVLAGANEEALIDTFFEHGVDGEEGMLFYMGENDSDLTLYHADDEEEEKEKEPEEDEQEEESEDPKEEEKEEDEDDSDSEDEEEEKDMKHSDEESGQTLKEAYEEMPEKYKKVCAALVGMATAGDAEDDSEDDEVEHSDEGGEIMKTNVFENDQIQEENVLQHSDLVEIIDTAKSSGSLKQAFNSYCLAHSIDTTGMNILPAQSTVGQTSGVRDLDMLFPDYKSLNNPPEWIKRDTTWADVVMAGVHKVPFKRIKSMFANITEDEARAKGYIKGEQKATEVFELLGRTTDPQTIYKMQQLDRDDILDIEDFDVVAWIKGEMQIMLTEEKARAILIGDGRTVSNHYKIKEDHVRPIANDVALFTIKKTVTNDQDLYEHFIEESLRARVDYKGSGNPTLFTTEQVLTELLLLKDKIGHPLYKTEQELATALRVSRIVTVEVMEGVQIDSKDLMGVIVNLNDYTIGGDGNREKGMFEDFDIDFNQYKYLIETRMSGALTRPYSAITLLKGAAAQQSGGQG